MKKSNKLIRRWMRRRAPERDCRTIGIIGSDRGAGVTHTALMMAGFLSGNTDGTIAVVEMNQTGDLVKLCQQMDAHWQPGRPAFSLRKKVRLYPACSREQIAEVMNEHYQYIILDFGAEWEWLEDEYLRCSCKIVVANTREWETEQTEALLKRIESIRGQEKWTYLSVFGNGEKWYGFRTIEIEHRLFICPERTAVLFGSIF